MFSVQCTRIRTVVYRPTKKQATHPVTAKRGPTLADARQRNYYYYIDKTTTTTK